MVSLVVPGVEIRARSWKLPERFVNLPTQKFQKLPAEENTFYFPELFSTL